MWSSGDKKITDPNQINLFNLPRKNVDQKAILWTYYKQVQLIQLNHQDTIRLYPTDHSGKKEEKEGLIVVNQRSHKYRKKKPHISLFLVAILYQLNFTPLIDNLLFAEY